METEQVKLPLTGALTFLLDRSLIFCYKLVLDLLAFYVASKNILSLEYNCSTFDTISFQIFYKQLNISATENLVEESRVQNFQVDPMSKDSLKYL